MNEDNSNLPVVEITSTEQKRSKLKTEEKNHEILIPDANETELTLKITKSTDKPQEKKHNKSTLEQLLHSDPRESVLSENKYKRASKQNFVLIEKRYVYGGSGVKDDLLFQTDLDPNSNSSVSEVKSNNPDSFLAIQLS